jgi:DNA-binding transcriptional ArsR family regulator
VPSALERRTGYDLAHIGDAIGEPSRAAMLVALMGGVALPASELARRARVAPSTATSHLRKLVQAGLVVARDTGRHRYFALAGGDIADAVERLASLVGTAPPRPRDDDPMAVARTCYAHLAGRVAVAFWRRAEDKGWVRRDDAVVTLLSAGLDALVRRELLAASTALPLEGKPCLDWTERVPHVSGRLGLAVCGALRANEWVKPIAGTRALRITTRGREGFASLGVRW